MSMQGTPVVRTAPTKIDGVSRAAPPSSGGSSFKVGYGAVLPGWWTPDQGDRVPMYNPVRIAFGSVVSDSGAFGWSPANPAVVWDSGGFSWSAANPEIITCINSGVYLFQGQVTSNAGGSSSQSLTVYVDRGGVSGGGRFFEGIIAGRSSSEMPSDQGDAIGQVFGVLPCVIGDTARLEWMHTTTTGRFIDNEETWLTASRLTDYVLPIDPMPGF